MKEVILIIFVMFSNGEKELVEYPMSNIWECRNTIESSQVKIPVQPPGTMGLAVITCGHRLKEEKDEDKIF